jgi:hypothetical protein
VEAARLQAEEARWQEAKTRMELARAHEQLADVERQLNEVRVRTLVPFYPYLGCPDVIIGRTSIIGQTHVMAIK